ncbi:MAG: hypothetical protein GPJ34_06510, partial [Microcystis aeruginosa LL11-07]|nr:hypothetical protein [Microcystis aeruginosa LL11-07]
GDEGDAGNGGGIWGEAGDDLLYGEAGGDALRGGDGNDTIYGGDGNDYLDGGLGDDVLIGVNPNNPIPGLNERDTIVSGTGSDRIILGDTHWLAYDDRNTTTNGTGDYATIADFDVNFDVIQLQGQKNNYRLAISGLDTWLYLDKPGTEPDELIAIIQGKTNLNLDSQNFVYVEPVNTPPTTSDNSLVTDEDTNLVFTANNFNFSDVDSDDSLQAIRLETLPTEGILYVDSNNNGIVNTGETISQGSLVTVAAINAGQLKFKPDANENGTPYTNFTFSVSDGEDLSITPAKITLNVTPINDAPTNIQLTNSNVNENSPINTIIGQISISDPDLNDTHTLTLIDDAGGRFKLVGSQLQVANASLLDYETKTNHSITIKASDTGNLSFEKALTITVNNVNESPSAIQLTNTSINENSPNSTVIGILNTTDPDANNTFTYSLVDNAGGRFAINGNQLIVADGTKLDYEINQKHTITIRTQDQGGLTYDQTFDINLIDVADSSVIAFSQPTYTVKEDGTPITEITLTRSISTQGQVSVTVTPSNGTATSPLDYNNAPITVTFADGETSKKIAIPIVKDTAYEGNETLNLTLSNPTNGATIGTQKTATLTIVDTPITYYLTTPTTWTDAQAQAQAMGGNLVTINDAAENQFLVNAFGSNESFWIGFTDAVQEGDWKWINGEPVTYVNWSLGEPNNNGNEDYGIINDPYDPGPSEKWYDLPNNPPSHFPPQLKGIIEVLNGTSTISIADTTINESENQATVTVKLTGISQQTFTVDYNTNDGTAKAGEDYTTVSGKLTFNAGESVKTITVLINNDTAYEGNETFTLNLSNPTGGAVLGTSTATITIIDNDVPKPGTLAFSNTQFSVKEDGTPVNVVTINRTNGSDGQVSATINLNNNTATTPNDYNNNPITVTFANGETQKTVTIPIVDDLQFEGNETLNLSLTNATGGAIIGTQDKATLTIVDNEINQGITLDEGQTKLINNTVLKAVETNKQPTDIIYNLTDLPDNGQLILSSNTLKSGNTFTQADLDNGLLTYQHNGSETTSDNFKFTLADVKNEFQVNTYTTNNQGFSDNYHQSSITALKDGGFVIVWSSQGQDGSDWGIYGQRYDTNSNKIGSEFQINTYTQNAQYNPSITALNSGGFVIVWASKLQDGSGNPIYGQRYDANGNKLGSEFQISTYTQDTQWWEPHASVATLNDGGFFVTWASELGDVNGNIYGQRYDANGNKVGTNFPINTYAYHVQIEASAITLTNGDLIVAWQSAHSSHWGLYGQRYDNNGNKLGTEFQIHSSPYYDYSGPKIAALSDGGFVVTYESGDWNGNGIDGSGYGVHGQKFDSTGNKLGGEFLINTYTTGNQFYQSVTALSNGGFLEVWQSQNQDGSGYGIYGQQFDANCNKIGNEFAINQYTANNQWFPAITTLADGSSVIITWTSENQDGSGNGIYARKFNTSDPPISTFNITINNVNDAPTDLQISNTKVDENSPNNTIIGVLNTTDSDVNDTFTYNLLDNADGRFTIFGNELRVANSNLLDAETNTNHNITVKVTDKGSLNLVKTFNITVNNLNENPTAIQLSNNSIPEDSINGIVIGTLTTTDPDLGDTHTYELINNAGGRFAINNNQLIVADGTKLDYETNTIYPVTIRSKDSGGLTYDQSFTINLIDVSEPGILAFSNANYSINEDGIPVNQIKIIRTGGSQGEVSTTIDLTNGTATSEDYDKTSIPVTFANGETEKFVTIPIANDTLVENTETINLTLINPTNGATLGTQKAAVLSILDDDVQLNFNAANYTVREDGTAVTDIIITRTGRTTGTVGATLNFANGTATGCPCPPASVTYDFYNGAFAFTLGDNEMSKVIQVEDAKLAGSNAIRIRNDSKVEGDEYFTINLNNPTGGATIGNQNSATVTILDDDVQLAFSSPTFTIREDGTAIAAVTVNRIGRLTGVVGATLNLDGGNATYPDDYTQTSLNISFAEGENSKIINIPVRNDIISEPDETVNLTLVNPTGGATIGSQNTAILTIVDNGLTPSLSLAIDKDTVAENAGNNAATATITRSIITDEDLIITLNSNDTSEITVPNQVIIPANQASATFTLNAVDDNITDGIQSVTINATANGFSQGVDTINVADINVPDLKIVNLSASTPLLTGKQGSFTYRVVNQGLSEAKGTWTDKIYLSTDTTLETNKDIFLDNYQFSGTIPTGLFYERNLPFFIPKTPGQYYLIAQTDTANTVKEGIGLGENNNTTITSINITPAYRATVSTDTEIGVTGNKVILQGKAFSNSDNSAVPYEFVTIAIKYNGTVRELTAFTDGNGNFVKEFQPLPGEGGQYQINAYFPNYSSEDSTAEDSFKLLGMRFNTGGAYYQINADSPFNATATLQNLTDIPITGITYSIDGAPQDWNIQVSAANTLAGNSNLPITYTITAPNNSPITQDTFNINLTSAEGVSTTLPVTINLRRIVPHLVANTNLLSNGMLRGQQTPIEFTVTNNGGIATGEVQVILPNAPWLKLASPVKLSSLNPGESSKVTLLLAPDANLPLTVYNGNLVLDVVGNDGDLSLPFSFRAVSDAVGSLQITVVDELTFFTESAPKLKDATIILRDYITGNEVRRITTDATGMVSWDNLSEGYYQLEVKAKSHDSYTQTIQIKAGETEDIESFLSRQTVKYVWRVVPTEIEDKYTITIESVFETHVPALDGSSDSIANPIPTVTIDPPLIDLINLQVIGQMMQVDMTVTNNGLIAANNVRLYFGEHPFYKIEPLIDNIGTLGAKSSITVPVRITRIGDFENLENNGLKALAATAQPNVRCTIDAKLIYDYICGVVIDKNGEKFNRNIEKSSPIAFQGVEGNCAYNPVFYTPVTPVTIVTDNHQIGSSLSPIPQVTLVSPNTPVINSSNCCIKLEKIGLDVGGAVDIILDPMEERINKFFEKCISGNGLLKIIGKSLKGIDLSIDSLKAEIGTCCDQNNKNGLTMNGEAKGIIRRNFLPSLEYSTNELIFEDEDEMGKLSYIIPQSDLELKGTPSIYGSIDVKVGKECYKSPQFTASVELGFDLDYGITANWQVSKLVKTTGALVPIDASLVRYLKGGLAVKGQYSSASKKWDTCFYSKGLYFEEYTSIGDKKFSVFDNLNTPDKTETTFNIFPSYVYLGNKNCLQDKQASLLATSLESELIPSFSFEEIFGESEDEFFRLLNLEQAVEEQSLTNQLQVQINQLLQGRGLSPISLTPEDDGTTPPPNPGVCAQVKLQINQDAIMTRSGFLGTLEIDNGNDTNNLENITVTINIKDSQGNTVNNLFGITNPTLSNLTAVDGTGTLLANASGSAEWTFIPTGNAAPNEPTIYSIGGSLSYKENGNNITVPLLSTPVTVFPQAELYLDYFHQRDVFADDPFTVEIEPSVPFSLGILVKNQGKGTAKNLHISSAQPKIIDNEKGLLIDFNIIGTQIGTESITPSLTVNFGNIEAGKTAVADWLFKSDLQGKFTDYKATFEHINDLGKPELSLIKEVKIHELTHQVNVDSDNLPDFLVNDIPDPNFYPDTLYFSNGATAPVNVVTNATATINNQQAQIIVNVNSGWTYLHLTEPSNGSLEIAQVLRSDGTSIKLDNVWTTDRTFPATGRPIYENILHLLDYNANAGNSNYTIIYTSGGPTVTDIIDVTPDPRSTAVNAITIDFSEPIQASTFDYTDLSLTLNNGTNLITNIVSIIPLSTTRYQVTGLENLTNIDGDYQLTVNANGIKDLDGKLGTGLLSETWIKTATGNADNTPPTVTDIRDLQIDPRNIPVSSLDVTLSEAIDLSSFTWEDITLTRNSGSNLINNTVTITPVNDTTYRINGLNNLTQTEGTYTLTVNGNEIKDLSGNLGIGSASEIWVMDTTPPDAPSNLKVGNKTITPNSQNLVNTTTLNLTGDLSETGLSVFLIDRTLNQSLGQASVNNTQFSSTIQLPSSGTRNLDIQIIDPAGNITTTNFNLFADIITPTLLEFLNIPQTPIATPINSIDLRFSEAINLSTFDYTDITLQRNNGENLINDAVTVEYLSGTTYRIKGLTELTTTTGNYQLTVNSNTLQDLAGNSGDAAKTATFAIITPTNNPPIAQDDALATNEDTIVTGNVLINNGSGADSDPDKDSLTVTAVNSNTANVGTQIILSSGALLTLNTNGTLTYNPNGQFEALKNGEITTDSFTYTLSDGNGGTDTATVTATITGVNDAPVANPDSYILDEDNTLTINTPGVKGNDTDAENDSLTVNLVSTVAKG